MSETELILREHEMKLAFLLARTKSLLKTIEGPGCRFHGPTFNVANHPYYWEWFARRGMRVSR